ncbi:MAG: ABC transporter permease [Chloroflexia bacterium]
MTLYIVRRIAQSFGFILIAWLVVYTGLVLIMPGGPGRNYAGIKAGDGSVVRRFRGEENYLAFRYKVDKPWPLDFVLWLFDPNDTIQFLSDANGNDYQVPKGIDLQIGNIRIQGSGVLTGDLGYTDSVGNDNPISDLLASRWVNTALLIAGSLLLALPLSLMLGIVSALRKRSRLDHALTFFSFIGFSIPPYMLGIFLVIGFAVLPYLWHQQYHWDWLPYFPAGYITDSDQEGNVTNRLYHLVLPALTLALPQVAYLSRYVRSSMLEVLKQDYIRTAWAKGLRARKVVLKHALRNALIPLITMIGVLVPGLAGGAILVETIFSYNGMGQLYFKAIGGCIVETQPCSPTGYPIDYPLSLTLTFILIVIVAISNLIADLLYTVVDPRISYD